MLDWCAERGVMFFNTAVYEWDHCGTEFEDFTAYTPLFDETIEEMAKVREINLAHSGKSATAVLSHGANPGLVNHLMKYGIEEIASAIITEKPDDPRVPELNAHLSTKNYALLAQLLGIKVVQVSERDTQRVSMNPEANQFISTWNVPSFCEELAAPAEFSWGTHEREAPAGAKFYGDGSFISLASRGHQTWAKSWMPGENEFKGMVVRHEECFSMADYISVRDETGALVYRPSVYFVYDQQLSAESIKKFVSNKYELLPHNSVVEREVEDGADKLGVLLLGTFYHFTVRCLSPIESARHCFTNLLDCQHQILCRFRHSTVAFLLTFRPPPCPWLLLTQVPAGFD